ncbi:YfhH family protein [Salsuginibacillus kocurii]|uniref:YfhH family protein n=1 Tax=Salsuginibacillus kocurii TaxID=427078 RepID=UPI00036AB1B6|nr:YfhH family protein [Salsuginibacillus kocurii]
MEKRYSQMNEQELQTEIAELNEKAKKAEAMGMINEFSVYERKKTMAQAYLLNPADFKPGTTYNVIGEGSTFLISYLNGTFAWGYRDSAEELEALPISLLAEK